MNYPAFTNRQPHHDVRGHPRALASDDALSGLGEGSQIPCSGDPEWEANPDLEAEMLRRGMIFEAIDWSETRESGLSS